MSFHEFTLARGDVSSLHLGLIDLIPPLYGVNPPSRGISLSYPCLIDKIHVEIRWQSHKVAEAMYINQ